MLKPKAHTAIRGTRDDNFGYVGLISYGQTCYVNSVLQQIFMNQELVKMICLAKVNRSKLYQESVNIFETLQSSSSRTTDPGNWIEAACHELGMHQLWIRVDVVVEFSPTNELARCRDTLFSLPLYRRWLPHSHLVVRASNASHTLEMSNAICRWEDRIVRCSP